MKVSVFITMYLYINIITFLDRKLIEDFFQNVAATYQDQPIKIVMKKEVAYAKRILWERSVINVPLDCMISQIVKVLKLISILRASSSVILLAS